MRPSASIHTTASAYSAGGVRRAIGEWSALVPRAAERVAFLACENDHICAVEVQGETIMARDTGMGVGAGLSIANGEVWVERANQRCVALRGGEVPSGRAAREVPCPQDRFVGPEDALPVNGALVSGIQAEAPRCQVRHEIRLPPLPGEPEDVPPQAAIVVVSDANLDEAGELTLELLVRGTTLGLGWRA